MAFGELVPALVPDRRDRHRYHSDSLAAGRTRYRFPDSDRKSLPMAAPDRRKLPARGWVPDTGFRACEAMEGSRERVGPRTEGRHLLAQHAEQRTALNALSPTKPVGAHLNHSGCQFRKS